MTLIDNVKHDALVQVWYATNKAPTAPAGKLFDWSLIDIMPMIYQKDVLNEGPSLSLDELLFAHYAKSWTAIDFTEEVIERCKARPPIGAATFLIGDFRSLPFEDTSLDTILDFSSSDHVKDNRAKVRAEAYRVLRDCGYYVLTYARSDTDSPKDNYESCGYEHRFTPNEIEAEVTAARFTIQEHRVLNGRSGLIAQKLVTG